MQAYPAYQCSTPFCSDHAKNSTSVCTQQTHAASCAQLLTLIKGLYGWSMHFKMAYGFFLVEASVAILSFKPHENNMHIANLAFANNASGHVTRNQLQLVVFPHMCNTM